MRWFLSAIGVLILSAAIAVANSAITESSNRHRYDPNAARLKSEIDGQYTPVSLVALFGNPKLYDGQRVRAGGFVSLAFEDCGLFLDEPSYSAALWRNAVWVDAPKWCAAATTRHLHRQYGEIAGTFKAAQLGHMGAYSGTLTQVRRIDRVHTRSDFLRWQERYRDEVLRMYLLSGPFLTLTGWAALGLLWLFLRLRSAD